MTEVRCSTTSKKYDTAEDVADLVREIDANAEQLETLILEANSFGVEPSKEIGQALSMCPNLKHLLLNDMFTSRLKSEIPDALTYIFNGVNESGAKLITLNLNDNAIGPVTMPALLPFLKSDSCSTLQALKLNNCGLGTKGGAMLSTALPELQQLNELIIGRNRLEIDGIRDISNALSKLSNLEVLELPQNGTKGEGIDALAQAIMANRKLRVLNLNDNCLKEKGAILGEAIASLNQTEKINFGDCLLSTAGAIEIVKAVQEAIQRNGRSCLQEIWLNGNEIGPRALDSIISAVNAILAVQSSDTSLMVDMSCNQLGEVGCERLRECFPSNEGGVELVIEDDDGTADEEERDTTLDLSYKANGEEKDQEWDASQLESKGVQELADILFTISVNRYNSQSSSLSDEAIERILSIYEEVQRRHVEPFNFINALLVSLGLLKDENRKSRRRQVPDLSGPLLAIKLFAAKLDTKQKNCLKVFLEQPPVNDPKYAAIKTELLSELWKF